MLLKRFFVSFVYGDKKGDMVFSNSMIDLDGELDDIGMINDLQTVIEENNKGVKKGTLIILNFQYIKDVFKEDM